MTSKLYGKKAHSFSLDDLDDLTEIDFSQYEAIIIDSVVELQPYQMELMRALRLDLPKKAAESPYEPGDIRRRDPKQPAWANRNQAPKSFRR